ncbi:Uma2 family endonuclease [Aquisphaera insulae]|uniref:Uma2 family endonuclease n=1 Tax=Aquisphaera insulae TaxID=2712864 RepID=UPI0013EDADA5|nr:Uma2 family endonuclease [Aquisphaera insulae]
MSTATPEAKPAVIPPLDNGDVLTREEFERRYDAMPELKKAELLEGEVFMGSPVRQREHSLPHTQLSCWLGTYAAFTPGVEPGDNGSVRLDDDNEPQPDLLLMIRPENGGRARIDEEGYIEGAPELVAEVAASSASRDANRKLRIYRNHGVLEYILWRVLDEKLDWLILREGRYEELAATADGVLRSEVFPGLWLDRGALLRGEMPRVLAVLQEGIATPEHAAFVGRLNPPR